MTLLIAGLLLFLGTHSLRIVADPWRARRIAQLGEGPWKGIYSVVSLAGFALIWVALLLYSIEGGFARLSQVRR